MIKLIMNDDLKNEISNVNEIDLMSRIEKKVTNELKSEKKMDYVLIKIFLKLISIAVLGCAIFFGTKYAITRLGIEKVTKNHTLASSQILLCQELTTVKNNYSSVVSVKKTKIAGLARAFSIVKFNGTIRAGILDISKSKIEVLDTKSVRVTLPKCQIIENGITNIEVFDEVQSVFVTVTMEEIVEQINLQKEETKILQIQNGILEEANSQAVKVVSTVLKAAGFEEVFVEIEK